MQHIKRLLSQGEYVEAFEKLSKLLDGEDQNIAIICLSEYQDHLNRVKKGIETYNPAQVNKIILRALWLCDSQKDFAPAPYLDNLPLDKDGYLLGRKAALKQLHNTLQKQSMLTVVNGVGGIGKSTLASFYANFPFYRLMYETCFWVTVSDITGDVIEAIINVFAPKLELYQMPKEMQLQKIAAHLKGLEKYVLLIIDNANDDAQVENSLEWLQTTNCKLLFTTRANIEGIEAQFLAELLPEDAFTLFTHYYAAGKDHPQTRQLLKNVAHHTLLVEFMAKTLNTNPTISIESLITITSQQDFTNEFFEYTKFKSYHTHTHGKAFEKIQPAKYLLQIFPIQNLSEQEQEILRYFSILPAEWIGIDMLLQLFAKDKEKTTYWQLGQVLQTLHEKGWLQKSPKNEFACHILVQHILRQQLQPSAENCEVLLENLNAIIDWDSYTNRLKLIPYLPLVSIVLSWVKKDIKLISDIYNNSAGIYRTIGDYEQALSYDLENVRIKEKILSDNDREIVISYNNITTNYIHLENYQKALQYGLKALTICQNEPSIENTLLVIIYNHISLIHKYLGNYLSALEYILKNVTICENVFTPNHPDLAITYSITSVIYQSLEDYQNSLIYALKALTIFKEILSDEHPNLATAYNNIASTYEKLGDYQQSLEYGLKALTIREKILSDEHPHLAASYNNIAKTYFYIKDYQKAYFYIQKAISIDLKILPKEHSHIQDALNTKAMIKEAMRGE